MSQKDVRLPVYHKNPARTKKISKGMDASGPTATRARVAPTVAAVPRRRAMAACRDHTHSQHLYTFTPRPPYIRFQNNPFGSKFQSRKSRPL
jgi:hypothetical protein